MMSSLKTRLVGYLLISQIFICAVSFVSLPILGASNLLGVEPFIGYNKQQSAWETVNSLIVQSLTRTRDGVTTLQPTPALRARAARNPDLKYAAYDIATRSAVPGSSPDLAATIGGMDSVFPGVTNLTSWDRKDGIAGQSLMVAPVRTPMGDFYVSASGFIFEWSDYWDITLWPVRPAIGWFSPVLVSSMFIVWLILWRELKSVSGLIGQANRIDFATHGERLLLTDIPSEMRPLVESINGALTRLEDGAARQRRFIANAAHELRTPVAILRSSIDAIDASSFKPELQGDVRHVQNILEQLLSTARAAEVPTLLNSDIDLAEVTRAVATDYFPLAIRNRRHIEFVGGNKPIMIHGDDRALKSIIGNLIDNALRAEPEDGAVIVQVGDDGVVGVIDHGDGVPESDRENIFEPFWRKSDSTPGTGLGLAIAEELINRLQGRIWVEDTPGGGATFKIALPQI